MKKRFGNCVHGLSLDISNPENCCIVCISPIKGEENYFDYLEKNQKDIDPEFVKIVEDNFFDLLL